MKQTMGFQTEVKQLLQLMIHSLYSNREIFLRELISNASDACDKLRFEALNNGDLYEGDGDLAVELEFDKAKRTITIRDNGIGMTHQEVIDNLGTIARSGTKEFFGKLSGDEGKDSQLIGQFGVGFYSAFIVASQVTVTTRKAGASAAEGVRWESDGSGEFSIETVERAKRGTEIVLQLRENKDEESFDDLLSQWTLKSIVEKYSDHISLPIKMLKQEWDKDASEYKQTGEWEVANQATALWARSKAEVTEEQYQSFYTHISHDSAKPLAYSHNRVEGRTEYTQLLFIPSKAPFDLYDRQAKHGLKLYVKRVFIMDDAEQLLPSYLRFVRGVIDSADLPLNVSREILQESRDVKAIREGCSKRVLSMLEDMAENRVEDYASFWKEFGQVLKEGLGEDFGNKDRIAKLLRFSTTNTGTDATVALATYVTNMKPEQEKIYYVTADSETGARNSPHLEVFRTKGIEVLLLTDRVDEWMLNHLQEFEGKQLVSVARGDLDLGKLASEEDKAKTEQVNEAFKPLVEGLQEALKDKVKEVRISSRLTDSPACLISDDGDMSGHLERLLKQAGQKAPDRKPILEINPDHALVKNIKAGSDSVSDWANLLFDQATLAEGGQLVDPAAFVKRVNQMLLAGMAA